MERPMSQTITAKELEANLGDYLSKVAKDGDAIVVERAGEPAAALVPLAVLRAHEERRRRFFEAAESISRQFADVPEAELQAEIDSAVAEVRAARRAARIKAVPGA